MRKLLSLALVAIMLLSMFMFASCDTALNLLQNYLDSNGKIDLGTKPEEVRYTITEEEWQKNMSETNYTLIGASNIGKVTPMEIQTADARIEKNDDGTIALFYFNKDGKQYRLFETDGSWAAINWTWEHKTIEERFSLGVAFSDLAYDEESESYSCDYKGFDGAKLIFKFEDGKISFIKAERGEEWETITFTNVGTTVIELPEYKLYEEDSSTRYTITEEEWQKNMEEINYTVVGVASTGGLQRPIRQSAEAFMEETAEEMPTIYYFIKDGEKYELEFENGAWVAKSYEWTPSTIYDILALPVEFSDLTYDESKNGYTIVYQECNITYKFENGIISEAKSEIGEYWAVMTFTNVGTTVVELPEYTMPE